jgi:hypothetical protein
VKEIDGDSSPEMVASRKEANRMGKRSRQKMSRAPRPKHDGKRFDSKTDTVLSLMRDETRRVIHTKATNTDWNKWAWDQPADPIKDFKNATTRLGTVSNKVNDDWKKFLEVLLSEARSRQEEEKAEILNKWMNMPQQNGGIVEYEMDPVTGNIYAKPRRKMTPEEELWRLFGDSGDKVIPHPNARPRLPLPSNFPVPPPKPPSNNFPPPQTYPNPFKTKFTKNGEEVIMPETNEEVPEHPALKKWTQEEARQKETDAFPGNTINKRRKAKAEATGLKLYTVSMAHAVPHSTYWMQTWAEKPIEAAEKYVNRDTENSTPAQLVREEDFLIVIVTEVPLMEDGVPYKSNLFQVVWEGKPVLEELGRKN